MSKVNLDYITDRVFENAKVIHKKIIRNYVGIYMRLPTVYSVELSPWLNRKLLEIRISVGNARTGYQPR